jgi:uncharacterized protein (DUF1501 family)
MSVRGCLVLLLAVMMCTGCIHVKETMQLNRDGSGIVHMTVKAFHDKMVRLKQDHRVLMLSFSEFGRRVNENYSQGTDHGVAGPVFLYGTPVAGGVIGDHPSLTDLDKGDLKSATDFRTIYAGIARDWMNVDPARVIGEQFKPLSFLSWKPSGTRERSDVAAAVRST